MALAFFVENCYYSHFTLIYFELDLIRSKEPFYIDPNTNTDNDMKNSLMSMGKIFSS